MEILPLIPLYTFFFGAVFWSRGCFVFGALVVTAPVGALLCRAWAGRQGQDAALRTLVVGAACWACGFVPWIYLACEINGREAPRKTVRAAYVALFTAWMWGPVMGGAFTASAAASGGAALFPVGSLLTWLAALIWVGFVGIKPDVPRGWHRKHLVPGLLGTLAMLAWWPFDLMFW